MLKFKVDTSGLAGIESRIQAEVNRAEKILAVQVMKDTNEYVPARQGTLAQETHIEGSTIVYPGPYARFLYYGKVMIYAPTGSTFAPRYGHKVVTDRDLTMHKTMHKNATSHWFEASKAANMEKWERVARKLVNGDGGEE